MGKINRSLKLKTNFRCWHKADRQFANLTPFPIITTIQTACENSKEDGVAPTYRLEMYYVSID